MYQVLLVDDEPSITAGMHRSIDWARYHCTVAAIALNGTQAMSIIDQQKIDIVITDIRMQQMGGLELCHELHNRYPQIQIIVISGYAEFSYAQKAIKYGILGYCLKPLEYEEIGIYLHQAVSKLQSAVSSYNSDDLLNALLNEDMKLLSNYLKSINKYHHTWYCSVFTGIQPPSDIDTSAILFGLGQKQYGYFSPLPIPEDIISQFLSRNEKNSVGISRAAVLLHNLPSGIKECQIKSLQYFIQPNCRLCETLPDDSASQLLNQLASWLSASNSNQLLQTLKGLKSSPELSFLSVRTAMRLNNMICSSGKYSSLEDNYYIYSIHQMTERYEGLSDMLDSLCELILNPNPSYTESELLTNTNFLKLIEFLNQNYTNDISANDLAQYMHLNPGYLSKVFKRETGITVTKYINNLRIQKSRQMLESGNYSISEIAAATGFHDYFYFLKTFKKIIGLTPRQYQLGENV